MPLSPGQVTVVLVEPTLPANVGSVARAMNNMGVTQLRLVNPCEFQNREARQTATHSWRILRCAAVFPTLAAAVADQHRIIGTTARLRGRHARITRLPDIHELLPSAEETLGLVFGRESSGLTNTELALCNGWVHIPTYGRHRSLNLAHAVAVTLYELSRAYGAPGRSGAKRTGLARAREVEAMKHHLFDLLREVHFLRPRQEELMWSRFSDLIGRAQPTELDVRLIRGFVHRVEVTLRRIRLQSDKD